MKNILPILAGAALLPIVAQATSTSNIVGYTTATINANTSGNTAGAVTYVAASLTEPISYAAAATASPSGGSTISLPDGVPAGLDGTYMLEITDGAEEGWWSTIVSSDDTADTITVIDVFPAGLAADVGVSVRLFTTVDSMFGANSPGLQDFDGVNADLIVVLDPVTQGTQSIVYILESTGFGLPDGWYDLVTTAPAGGVILYPGTAVQVVNYGATDLSLVVSGEVKETKTQVDVYPQDNWLGQPNPTGGTLGSMDFAPQLLWFDGADSTTCDFLNLTRPDLGTGQATDSYVALDPALGAGNIMANFVTTADATNEPLPAGTGYVIRRPAGAAASVITIPAQVIGN